MEKNKNSLVWWLSHNDHRKLASTDMSVLFRVIACRLGKSLTEVTVKEAYDAGFTIRRAGIC